MADASARLVLWDIDGTLLQSGGVGAEVFEPGDRAGSRLATAGEDHHERQDRPPDLSGASRPARPGGPRRPHPGRARYLAEELAAREATITEEGTCSRVERALETLGRAEWCHQSVLSGNLAANALVKLRAFSLERFLDTTTGRTAATTRIATSSCPSHSSARRPQGRAVRARSRLVIGDSPNDLACARAGGVRLRPVSQPAASGPTSCRPSGPTPASTTLPTPRPSSRSSAPDRRERAAPSRYPRPVEPTDFLAHRPRSCS